MNGKNMLLLGQEESPNWQPSIHEIIRDLREEILRGEAIYTSVELRTLELKLAEYEQTLLTLLER